MVSTRIAMNDEHILATFRRFDTDNTGFITQEKLKCVLSSDFSEQDMQELIKAVDPENGDKISYERFVAYLRSGDARDKYSAVALNIIDRRERVHAVISED